MRWKALGSAKSHPFFPLRVLKRHQPARQAAERKVGWNHLERTKSYDVRIENFDVSFGDSEGVWWGSGADGVLFCFVFYS